MKKSILTLLAAVFASSVLFSGIAAAADQPCGDQSKQSMERTSTYNPLDFNDTYND